MKLRKMTSFQQLILLSFLYTSSIHLNKYILSVLGFTYPTVFQGWQTLIAVILLRLLIPNSVTPLCWNTFLYHLPYFLSYVGSIVTASKALSVLPIPVIITISSVIPSAKHLFRTFTLEEKKPLPVTAAVLSIFSAFIVVYLDPTLAEMRAPSLWIALHIFFVGVMSCVGDDRTLSCFDQLFYSNIFSVVILAPSSFYLEEAFEALHFEKGKQVSFLISCIFSGIFSTLVCLVSVNLASTYDNVLAVPKIIACLLSPFVLPCPLSYLMWTSVLVNLLTGVFISEGSLEMTEKIRLMTVEEV